MIIRIINFLQNGKALRGFPVAFLLKIFSENVFNDRLIVFIYDFFAHNLIYKGKSLFTANLVYPVNFFQPLYDRVQDIIILYNQGYATTEYTI